MNESNTKKELKKLVECVKVNNKKIKLKGEHFIALFRSQTYQELMLEAKKEECSRISKNIVNYVNKLTMKSYGQPLFTLDTDWKTMIHETFFKK